MSYVVAPMDIRIGAAGPLAHRRAAAGVPYGAYGIYGIYGTYGTYGTHGARESILPHLTIVRLITGIRALGPVKTLHYHLRRTVRHGLHILQSAASPGTSARRPVPS